MKYCNSIIAGLALVLTLAGAPVQAQLGALRLKGLTTSDEVTEQQTQIMKDYSAAGALLAKAMGLTIEALGSKAEADKFRAEAKDLTGEACENKKGCEQVHTVLSSGAKQVDELIAKADKLSEEQKAKVKESLVPFGGGLAIDAGLVAFSVETAKRAQDAVKSNPLAATKYAPAVYVAMILPGEVKTTGQVLNNYSKLAKKNGIEVPDNVTKALTGPQ